MEWSRVKGIPNPKSAGKGKTVHADYLLSPQEVFVIEDYQKL
jgi:hypothetical protein